MNVFKRPYAVSISSKFNAGTAKVLAAETPPNCKDFRQERQQEGPILHIPAVRVTVGPYILVP